jgi:hypothetical protein
MTTPNGGFPPIFLLNKKKDIEQKKITHQYANINEILGKKQIKQFMTLSEKDNSNLDNYINIDQEYTVNFDSVKL